MTTIERYQKARQSGVPARWALQQARTFEKPPTIPYEYGRERLAFERDGFTVVVEVIPDEYVDLSDMGYGQFMGSARDWRDTGWQSRPHPDAIRVHTGNERDGNTWYVPNLGGQTMAQAAADYRKGGASKAVALDMARAQAKAELQNVDPGQYGPDVRIVDVRVYRAGVELARESLHGVELDGSDWDAYWVSETAEELIPQALDAAREKLAELAEGC